MGDADGEDDAAGFEALAVGQVQAKVSPYPLEFCDVDRFEMRREASLEGLAIVRKGFEADRPSDPCERNALIRAVTLQCHFASRFGQVRRETFGLEQHALRHQVAPALHGSAEDPMFDAPRAQMCGNRQTIGTCANNSYVKHS